MTMKPWSVITSAQMRAYAEEAQKLVDFAEHHKISPFAAALAGVALIRNAIVRMNSDATWWCKLVMSTKDNPFEEMNS
jgi:hypothetical protein